jgi:hypothetical protein
MGFTVMSNGEWSRVILWSSGFLWDSGLLENQHRNRFFRQPPGTSGNSSYIDYINGKEENSFMDVFIDEYEYSIFFR